MSVIASLALADSSSAWSSVCSWGEGEIECQRPSKTQTGYSESKKGTDKLALSVGIRCGRLGLGLGRAQKLLQTVSLYAKVGL